MSKNKFKIFLNYTLRPLFVEWWGTIPAIKRSETIPLIEGMDTSKLLSNSMLEKIAMRMMVDKVLRNDLDKDGNINKFLRESASDKDSK